MLIRLILTLTLTFLFGLGQQGAIVHQLSHLDDLASSSHQQDKTAHSVCDECLSHSVFAFALGVNSFQPSIAKPELEPVTYLLAQLGNCTAPTYQARAPPLFI